MPAQHSQALDRAEQVRRFNRFYTRRIGVLQDHLLGSPFSLTEMRVLYELSSRGAARALDLRTELGLNAGYLSRVIATLESQGLLEKTRHPDDARSQLLALTALGRQTFQPFEEASRQEVLAMLAPLPEAQQQALVYAMDRIGQLLDRRPADVVLRAPQPGDMGLVVHKQARLYAQEYGWNQEFEALLADIVGKYLREFDPTSDRCWIADRQGEMVGSVFVVRHDATTAKLRMLYVDATARGLGVGRRLVEEAIGFARAAGYTRMVLWTNKVLLDAVRLYEKTGFSLVEEEHHHSFGSDQTSQVWARDLA
ncbi:helix-turn-helix domain-containing GNAT family N-acetyltransferase [Stenotrophomonas sp. SI-NJAU-1]|uniref:bifunctional helix-turn-helix transcriptional regulator/GNAT family N-acetyltransferase n=1 Tax=Stenotrophomonas sp. SI-NJAU-1 TaxID=2886359 RepID=UPI001E31BBCF|nr:helix-turn-helix domain-containing GNAT family N-acetyltransferase [Stenotrophomonas sp. SI-NJAU-1]UEX18035.1 helix-turn-helix domain-containing GNAT family N-acetyltransferase [Stenotrophomonas sp. SI-NJAU-1]